MCIRDRDYTCTAFLPKSSDYCLLIPVINEGSRILTELGRAQKAGVDRLVDIVICDGGSTDGSMNPDTLEMYGVNTLLVKTGPGKQGAQLRRDVYKRQGFRQGLRRPQGCRQRRCDQNARL